MRRGRKNAIQRRKVLRDELRDILQAVTLDEDQEVVRAAHEKARLDLLELGNPLSDPAESGIALRRYLELDDCMYIIHFRCSFPTSS